MKQRIGNTKASLATGVSTVLALVAVSPAMAQTAPKAPGDNAIALEEVIVTAQKRSENIDKVAMSIGA